MPTFDELKAGKVKLEFGNPAHIAIIDRKIEQTEIQKLEGDDSVLKLYFAEYSVAGEGYIFITAHSEEEAREKAEGKSYFDLTDTNLDVDLLDIKLRDKA